MWCVPGMLRAAATVVALLAALPAVTPLLGGYSLFPGCRNLTHMGPGLWPDYSPNYYNYTGLLVMPGITCSGFMVSWQHMVSTSLCRLWKDKVDFCDDIEEDGSEVRLGIIQGLVSSSFYLRQRVRRYVHWTHDLKDVLKDPVMIVELENPFTGQDEGTLASVFKSTPFAIGEEEYVVGDIVGYEHSVNMPIYHQAAFDARLFMYKDVFKKYGRTKYDVQEAFITWDVSPERTVCGIDRGAPVVYKRAILGLVLGIIDDMEEQSKYCGEGRIHYNIFLLMRKYTNWIKNVTSGRATIFSFENGKYVEQECDADVELPVTHPPARRRTTKRARYRKARTATGHQKVSLGPLLLAAVATVAHLASQY